jgi:hypothetical protein
VLTAERACQSGENPCSDSLVGVLASEIGMSSAHLSRKMKILPKDYLRKGIEGLALKRIDRLVERKFWNRQLLHFVNLLSQLINRRQDRNF